METSALATWLGDVPELDGLREVCVRMVAAVVLGAIVGVQRELVGKPAGLRTHALVTLAAAIFTVVPLQSGMGLEGISRVIQGVATGIGFIGAGVILKRHEEGEVLGLTTAASIWVATAIGISIGLGHIVIASIAVLLTWVVLGFLNFLDRWVARKRDASVIDGMGAESERD